MRKLFPACAVLAFFVAASTAQAHYLWLVVKENRKTGATAHIYFEEGPAPRDGKYLDPFVKHGRARFRTADVKKPSDLKLVETKTPGKRWLTARVPGQPPRTVDCYGKWGVYRYGKTDVLLHYYARHIPKAAPGELEKLAPAAHLRLDIVPSRVDDAIVLRVVWDNRPAVGRPVYVRGPKLSKKLTTDKEGTVRIPNAGKGRYLLRTNVELNKEGTDAGKTYQKIRHHATLALDIE